MSLLPFFEWCEQAPLIVAMRGSLWLFPVIESLHLMGLALLGGAVVTVDLRLLGLGLRNQPVAQVARDAEKWLLVGLSVMLPTGWLLFMASAVKCYYLTAFWLKMTSLRSGARVYVWRPAQGDAGRRTDHERGSARDGRRRFAGLVVLRGDCRPVCRISVTRTNRTPND